MLQDPGEEPQVQRQRGRPQLRMFGKAAREFLCRAGYRQRHRQGEIVALWERAAGPEIARHTRIIEWRQNVLRVAVDSSPLLQELVSFHRERLVRALREGDPPLLVRQLRFQVESQ